MSVLILGHRGASGTHPENTPEAFVAADAAGADGVELDVRIASSPAGLRLVVHHDPLPDDPQFVADLPSFADVLDACGERMLVNVEIKNTEGSDEFDPTMAVVAPTVAALRRRGPRWVERVLISSFSPRTLDHCRRIGPEFATAQLTTAWGRDDGRPLVATARAAGHRAVHPWHAVVTEQMVAEAHDAGMAVNVWTVNDAERIAELAAMGVDGACTDLPAMALEALGRTQPAPGDRPSWT